MTRLTYVSRSHFNPNNWTVWTANGETVRDMDILAENIELPRAIACAEVAGGSLLTLDLSFNPAY